MKTVGFLHTAEVHRETFEDLVRSADPEAAVHHRVMPELLDAAMERGVDRGLETAILEVLKDLADAGCQAISCTCSTLGPVVEQLALPDVVLQRIDRAAADKAMAFDQVLVLAAIESAAEAADSLLESSREKLGSGTRWMVMLVPEAWILFQSGQMAAYHQVVADFVNHYGQAYDAVLLSQASMADAAPLCESVDAELVLTTPEWGVRALLASLA